MAKVNRKLGPVGIAQRQVEKNTDNKFEEARELAQPKTKLAPPGRVSPQISCTVSPDDRKLLDELTMFAINKTQRPLNTSTIIRALIRLGYSRKDELEF